MNSNKAGNTVQLASQTRNTDKQMISHSTVGGCSGCGKGPPSVTLYNGPGGPGRPGSPRPPLVPFGPVGP